MMLTQALLAAGLVFSAATAHFTLDFPQSRGFVEDNEPQFCGGFSDVETRQPFPLSQGPIWIDSHHPAAVLDAFISVSSDPTSFNDFNSTSNGTNIPFLTPFFKINAQGEFCWNVSMSGLDIGLTNGSLVTLQVQFNGGDGTLYQCTDLVLLSDYTVPSNYTCAIDATTNPTGTVSLAGSSSTASASGSASASATSSPASSSAAASHSGAALQNVQAYWLQSGLLAALAGLLLA